MSSSGHKPEPLVVRNWGLDEWIASRAVCIELEARASGDPLFLSWDWMTQWWRYFGEAVGNDARILAIYRGSKLVGFAPLYCRRLLRGGVLPVRSIQMIGLAWRDSYPLISEYLDVIAAAEDVEEVRAACVSAILELKDWTEFVLGFTEAAVNWRNSLVAGSHGVCHVRERDRSIAYEADLSNGFTSYLHDLRQSTRRSMWNLRRRLGPPGAVTVRQIGPGCINDAFETLNRLHQLRWGHPAFAGKRLEFHREFAAGASARGELAFTELCIDGRVVSALYDLRKSGRQYNMKMAFDPRFNARVSLGLIHLGYAMEIGSEKGIATYDFLAGPGRTSDFKRLLSQRQIQLSCLQMVRGSWLPRIYRWRDKRISPSVNDH